MSSETAPHESLGDGRKTAKRLQMTIQDFAAKRLLAWSEIIGGMVETAGSSSPCSTPVLKNSGDPDFRDMLKLVETINPGRELRFSELVDFAADYNLFENLIPAEEEEKAIAAAKRKKLSQLWKGYNERVFPQGQRFRIVGETQKTRRYLVEQNNGERPWNETG